MLLNPSSTCRSAFDLVVDLLLETERVEGVDIKEVVKSMGATQDVKAREEAAAMAIV